MKITKAILIVVGLAFIAVGAWMVWGGPKPPLTDRAQLLANIKAMQQAAARRSSNGIMDYVGKDFHWNGRDRHGLESLLGGVTFEFTKIEIKTNNVHVSVQGDKATTSGSYTLTAQQRNSDETKTYNGTFEATWQKQKGKWMVIKATTSGESPL